MLFVRLLETESLISDILMDMDGNKQKRNKILLMKNIGSLKEERNKTHHLPMNNMDLYGIQLSGFAE